MKEFDLSSRMWDESGKGDTLIQGQDVKEFIREELILIKLLFTNKITWNQFLTKRNKLAGKDLNGN